MSVKGDKNTIAKELRSLHGLLYSSKINVQNLKVLNTAASSCKNSPLPLEWSYSFENLIFKDICLGRKIRPDDLDGDLADISLRLSIKITGNILEDKIADPLSQMGVNFVIGGEYLVELVDEEDLKKRVICSWHLDRDKNEEDKKEDELDEFTHPKYHFNFGGKAMTKAEDIKKYIDIENMAFGNVLLLETPRLAHFPMDAILAVDFVLHNFYSKEIHKELIENASYQKIVKAAQYRLWRPYVLSVASKWDSNIDVEEGFEPKGLFPNLY